MERQNDDDKGQSSGPISKGYISGFLRSIAEHERVLGRQAKTAIVGRDVWNGLTKELGIEPVSDSFSLVEVVVFLSSYCEDEGGHSMYA